jgi:hypothetical protein
MPFRFQKFWVTGKFVGPKQDVKFTQFRRFFEEPDVTRAKIVETTGDDDLFHFVFSTMRT